MSGSYLASDTPIAVPGGAAPIGDLEVGEEVLIGSSSQGGVSWASAPLVCSEGDPASPEGRAMLWLVYGDDARSLIASPDQAFMRVSGELTTCTEVAPGDELMDADGKATQVAEVRTGRYDGGIHQIAAEMSWTGSSDGHLIIANGLVAGDFTLRLDPPES